MPMMISSKRLFSSPGRHESSGQILHLKPDFRSESAVIVSLSPAPQHLEPEALLFPRPDPLDPGDDGHADEAGGLQGVEGVRRHQVRVLLGGVGVELKERKDIY